MNGWVARVAAVAGLFVLSVGSAPAGDEVLAAGNIRACFVDLQEVLRNYPDYVSAKESLENWAKPKQKMITEKEKDIQKLDNDLKKNLLRSEDAKKDKEGEFKKELNSYQDMVKQLQGELAEKEDELLAPVKEMLSKVIEEVSKARGFNVVFDAATAGGRPILYVADTLDITEEVVEKVKAKSGSKTDAKDDKDGKDEKGKEKK